MMMQTTVPDTFSRLTPFPDPANATSTTWTIADGSGGGVLLSISDVDQTELRADATLGGRAWQSLAIVTATSGAMVVRVDATGSSGRVVADAVALVEVVQAVESGQNGRDGDVVLAAAEGSGSSTPRSGWFWENYAGPAIQGWLDFANGITNLINHTDNAFRWVENGALATVNEVAMMSNYGRPVFDPIPYVEVRDWSRDIAAPQPESIHQFNLQASELLGGVLAGRAIGRFGTPRWSAAPQPTFPRSVQGYHDREFIEARLEAARERLAEAEAAGATDAVKQFLKDMVAKLEELYNGPHP